MPKKILILGAGGMLGHKLMQTLSTDFDVAGTIRTPSPRLQEFFPNAKLFAGVTGEDIDSIIQVATKHKPDVIINCIGIVKQLSEAKDHIKSIQINSLLPHRVAAFSQAIGARFFHVSTDCVFSGQKGNYVEADLADARDLYGRSKLMGEVDAPGCITLRTSIIGHQLTGSHALVEWFLKQAGKTCSGYTKAIYTGLPTLCLSDVIKRLIVDYPNLSGLYHVSSSPISKFDLLKLIDKVYSTNTIVNPDGSLVCDRSLNSQRFKDATGIEIPSWPDMIERMYADGAIYDRARQRDLIKH